MPQTASPGVTFDITERKLVEEAARRSEQQLKLITVAVPFLISYIDFGQRYRFNNQVCRTELCETIRAKRGRPTASAAALTA